MKNQVGLAMQMVKIKLCDRNITFGNNPRRLWICGSTQILMSSCRMWTSRLSLIPFPPPPSPKNVLHTVDVKLSISTLYQGSSSISQATPSSVRNFIAATFDNVIQWYINTVSIREMKIRQFVKLTQGWVMNFYIDWKFSHIILCTRLYVYLWIITPIVKHWF